METAQQLLLLPLLHTHTQQHAPRFANCQMPSGTVAQPPAGKSMVPGVYTSVSRQPRMDYGCSNARLASSDTAISCVGVTTQSTSSSCGSRGTRSISWQSKESPTAVAARK